MAFERPILQLVMRMQLNDARSEYSPQRALEIAGRIQFHQVTLAGNTKASGVSDIDPAQREIFNDSYQRFVISRLRELLPYPEVPIRLVLRGKSGKGGKDVPEEKTATTEDQRPAERLKRPEKTSKKTAAGAKERGKRYAHRHLEIPSVRIAAHWVRDRRYAVT